MTIMYLSSNEDGLKSRVVGMNALGFNLLGFSKSITLFKTMLFTPINLLIIDLEYLDLDIESIERYLAISPDLIIFILVSPNVDKSSYTAFLKAGASRILSNTIDDECMVANIEAARRGRSKKVNLTSNAMTIWKLNIISGMLSMPDGNIVELDSRESKLIQLLAFKKGEAVSREFLNEELLGQLINKGSRSIDVLITRLRKKVLSVSNIELPLRAEHKKGYKLACQLIIE
jgi:DNA-binding response OmpR family regulator